MAEQFRKSSLEKLSSPEQLDRAITIISPSFWIAAIGGSLIMIVALLWSIFGRLPVNVSADGMYMGTSGIYNAVAEASGFVDEVYIEEGESVKKGQKLVQLDTAAYDKQIADLQDRRDIADSVTFYSYDDVSNADTKPLLDIKSQSKVSGTDLSADQIALRERYRALSGQRNARNSAKAAYSSSKSRYQKKQKEYLKAQTKYKNAQEALAAANNAYESYAKTVDDPPSEDQEAQLKSLEKAAREAADDCRKAESSAQKLEMELKNAEASYNKDLQTYQTENASYKQLKDTVSQMEAKVRGDKAGKSDQLDSLEAQFDSAKGSVIDQLDQEIKKLKAESDNMLFTARMDGKVTSVNVSAGDAVQSGSPIFKIVSTDDEQDDVVCYVPVAEGRKIKEGMPAAVYSSTVNRQEYGHMNGTVIFVSQYTVTSEDLLNELGDQTLVQGFQANGSVVRVTIKLERDSETKSGFRWSSRKGKNVTLDEGTVISADIVTEKKAPISMLVPYLKQKLLVGDRQDNNQNLNEQQQQQTAE